MGSLASSVLFQTPVTAPSHSHEVGAHPFWSEATVMRVDHTDGELTYIEEVKAGVIPAQPRELDIGGKRFSWLRMEVKVASDDNIGPRDGLIVAEHPYPNGWVHFTSFKPYSKKSSVERSADLSFDSNDDALEWIEDLSHDFWEKGNRLTAGISQPRARVHERTRNVQRRALFVFGSCRDFDACVEELWHSNLVGQLLDETEKGTIQFWYQYAPLSTVPSLCDEVVDDRQRLMYLSIIQALAGPHRDSEKWLGEPVTAKISQVYRDHLNACNRSTWKQKSREYEFVEQADSI